MTSGTINWYGLPVIVILSIIDFALYQSEKKRNFDSKQLNRGLKAFEQIGRFTVMFFMIVTLGIAGKGFLSDLMRDFWVITVAFMILFYIVCAIFYHKSKNHLLDMACAIDESIIFMLTGLLEQDFPLLMFSIIFAIGHIYVVSKKE